MAHVQKVHILGCIVLMKIEMITYNARSAGNMSLGPQLATRSAVQHDARITSHR